MMYGNRFFEYGGGFGHGFYGMHFLMMGILLIVAVVLILWARKKHFSGAGDPALNILKEKFVTGEITEEEYLSRKNILSRK